MRAPQHRPARTDGLRTLRHRLRVGSHGTGFALRVNDNVASPRAIIASLKIQSRDGRRILAQRDISRRDFMVVNDWQRFHLYFENPCGEELETVIDWRATRS